MDYARASSGWLGDPIQPGASGEPKGPRPARGRKSCGDNGLWDYD